MSSDAALLQEIQRLTGAIDRHKSSARPPTSKTYHPYPPPSSANRKYVNPAIASKHINPQADPVSSVPGSAPSSSKPREVVIDGVAFESSHRKLMRVDLKTNLSDSSNASGVPFSRTEAKKGSDYAIPKPIRKPKFPKRRVLRGRNNLILDNVKGTRSGKPPKAKKQCRFFTMKGECQRGRTCPYQHDPEKIAICPPFLSNSCPNTAENCRLSHDPTPSRVPLCHHFSNYGRCTREKCPYPHIRVEPRSGVCRDFAVVGYCDKGIVCDKQHVRECPDFAEKGSCPNKSCKLPHVIRANMRRKLPTATQSTVNLGPSITTSPVVSGIVHAVDSKASNELPSATIVGDTGAAEEFISLTFEESEDESDDEGSDDDNDSVASEEDAVF